MRFGAVREVERLSWIDVLCVSFSIVDVTGRFAVVLVYVRNVAVKGKRADDRRLKLG